LQCVLQCVLQAGRQATQLSPVSCIIGKTCHWKEGEHTATRCNKLQHTATHCNTLRHTAAHCNRPCRVIGVTCHWKEGGGGQFTRLCLIYGVATISRLLKLHVSFAKEPYKRDYILQKRPIHNRVRHTLGYGVATISRFLKITCLLCKRAQ